MTATLYGIKSCDTCRKARRFLDDAGIDHRFHDLRADGLTAGELKRWVDHVGWETLLNRRSTTWRDLDASEREGIDAAGAVALMLRHPTLVKRPVLDTGDTVEVGFSASRYQALLKA